MVKVLKEWDFKHFGERDIGVTQSIKVDFNYSIAF